MNIIINAASIFKGGAEQVAHSFINECINFPQHNYHVLLRDNIKSQLETDIFPGNFTFHDIKHRPGRNIWHVYSAIMHFDDLAEKIKPDAVISTGGHGFWMPEIPVVGGFNIPHYVYPESPYFDKISWKRKLYWKLKKVFDLYFYRRLDAVVVQTDDVRDRLTRLIKGVPIYSVSNTVNAAFLREEPGSGLLGEKKGDEFRLLTLSANYPHKNLSIIRPVIRELKKRNLENIRFIVTLPESAYKELMDERTEGQILNIGRVDIDKCPALYRDCDAMFLPTLLECFSASYAEAMKMEKPILTSNLGFAHTVCKKAALYFDPLDPADIADKIQRLATNANLYQKLAFEGREQFRKLNTPAERAECFLDIAESLVKKKKSTTKI